MTAGQATTLQAILMPVQLADFLLIEILQTNESINHFTSNLWIYYKIIWRNQTYIHWIILFFDSHSQPITSSGFQTKQIDSTRIAAITMKIQIRGYANFGNYLEFVDTFSKSDHDVVATQEKEFSKRKMSLLRCGRCGIEIPSGENRLGLLNCVNLLFIIFTNVTMFELSWNKNAIITACAVCKRM